MEIKEDIDQLLRARSEIDEELRRQQTKQTVVFTDIVGSTTYFDRFGDTAGLVLLYRHDSVVVGAIEEYDGTVIKTIGDSVMAQFEDPLHAVRAAIAMQQRLLEHNRNLPPNERIQIRIGINSGFGFRRSNDLFGDSVNVAARITKRCGPAQILVSHSVFNETSAADVSFKSIGKVSFAGKSDAEEIHEVVWLEAGAYKALRTNLNAIEKASANRIPSIGVMLARVRPFIAAASMRTTALVVAYLLLGAAMFASRADTKRPPVLPPQVVPVAVEHFEPPPAVESEAENLVVPQPVVAAPVDLPQTANLGLPQPAKPGPLVTVKLPPPVATLDKAAATSPAVKVEPAPVPKPAVPDRHPAWLTLIDTVSIPGGTFMMGSESGKGDEKPVHQVKVDGFNMSRTEITNRQYLAFLDATGYARPKDPGFAKNYLLDYPDFPVINVSYDDAIAFCVWASKKFDAEVRLPTEAEWEYASLGGEAARPFAWGDQDPKTKVRFKGNAPKLGVPTVSKGEFPANHFGLYNMNGNVSEWVLDYYSKDYYSTSPIRNPKGPIAGTKRSIRGGSWADDEQALGIARRANRGPAERSDQIGFRVVASFPPNPDSSQP